MTIEHIVVAIPARDEEVTLDSCLESVLDACEASAVPSTVVLILDSCSDRSAAIARQYPEVVTIERDYGNVGRARDAAATAGLRLAGGDPEHTWIAFTDADTAVPAPWLRAHLSAAAQADAFVGAVVPRLDDLDQARRGVWLRTHPPGATLGHVHGANLGVRANAYLAVGGVPALTVGEDVDLVARLRAAGYRIAESERHPVVTSARLEGRAPDGYAAYLREMAS
ncbi:glycosyl transferase [Leifsonia sp. LS1]|uniref:glycosyltransferase n=1 Tax=Leifsonia sp. LS1 TaxID=2828483 RepID=UPI001CFED669|nr:glycosyltransferase [Leifsonia sp. LS1]GIT78715.1 glycosyl transferase [Leifsonia sp. LS1]